MRADTNSSLYIRTRKYILVGMKKFGLHLLLHLIIKQKVDSAMQSTLLSIVDPYSQLRHLQDESTEAVKIAMFSE